VSTGHSNPGSISQGSHRMEVAWDQQADRSPSGVQYARHRPEETLLYRVIDDHYPDFLAQIEMVYGWRLFRVPPRIAQRRRRDPDVFCARDQSTPNRHLHGYIMHDVHHLPVRSAH